MPTPGTAWYRNRRRASGARSSAGSSGHRWSPVCWPDSGCHGRSRWACCPATGSPPPLKAPRRSSTLCFRSSGWPPSPWKDPREPLNLAIQDLLRDLRPKTQRAADLALSLSLRQLAQIHGPAEVRYNHVFGISKDEAGGSRHCRRGGACRRRASSSSSRSSASPGTSSPAVASSCGSGRASIPVSDLNKTCCFPVEVQRDGHGRRSRIALLVADDDHGAARVVHAVLAHRAEQRLGEPAVPAAAHHQKIGAIGGVEQYPRGVALDGSGPHRDVAVRAAGRADRFGQDLLARFP